MTSIVREGRATLVLALPLMAGQVSQMLMGLVDTYMIGKIGTVELAASTLAHSILHLPLMLGIGIAIAVSVKVSQARGAEDPQQAKAALRDGFLLSLLLGVATFILSWLSLPLISFFGSGSRGCRSITRILSFGECFDDSGDHYDGCPQSFRWNGETLASILDRSSGSLFECFSELVVH
jgi:Na+-driven multidrug efflux pump